MKISQIFPPTQPMGGSELMLKALKLHVPQIDKINLILSICDYRNISKDKSNIIWQQLNIDQDMTKLMQDKNFTNKIDYFIYNSNWCFEKFRKMYNTPDGKSIVIKNAINPIEFKKKEGKIHLIYTSTPWRGLDVLLKSFEILNRNDIELDIFSSTIIYGSQFARATEGQFEHLFNIAKSMKNVNYYGYATNEVVRQHFQKSHIFAYPNTWEETSCIAAIEAMAAGCQIVTTNFGALYETCSEWAVYVPHQHNHLNLAYKFAEKLNYIIDNYYSKETQELIKEQSNWANKYYCWGKRKLEWEAFLNGI